MSTRSNIKLVDGYSTLWFYRHSDGYPSGVQPTLKKFMQHIKDGEIRNNCSQAGGWLIILGAQEYNYHKDYDNKETLYTPKDDLSLNSYKPSKEDGYGNGWKVGAYEPTNEEHGDIEYLYEVNLADLSLTINGLAIDWEAESWEDAHNSVYKGDDEGEEVY